MPVLVKPELHGGERVRLNAQWGAIVGLVLVSMPAVAQVPPRLVLRPGDTTFEASFTQISGLRELRDGRILVADRGDNLLVVVDFRSRTVTPVGRSGSGPGEFTRVSQLFRLSADSTLMPDDGARRWLILDGDRIVKTISAQETPLGAGYVLLKGTDAHGRLLATTAFGGVAKKPTTVDSLLLIVAHRIDRTRDTIGHLRSPFPPGAFALGGLVAYRATAESVDIAARARAKMDDAVMYPDGWVAIIRRTPPQVEWYSPTGGKGRVLVPSPLASWTPSASPVEAWSPSAVPTPEGRLVVNRATDGSTSGVFYDVIHRDRGVVSVLAMPKNERILGFGSRFIYVSVTDEDGIQRIRRHPWP
jgi:hypothetical protein